MHRHQWASLVAQYKNKQIAIETASVCLKCGVLKIGKHSIKISRYRLDMGDTPIRNVTGISIKETAGGSDHTASGLIVPMTAGENLVFGDFVYFKSDGTCWKADANVAASFPCMGLAIATINAAAAGDILLHGTARDDTWAWTVGGVIYLSTTAGAATQTQPAATDDVIQVLGIAIHADRMLFRPQFDYITHT